MVRDYLETLNEEQRAAIENDSNTLVVAGAGTGKTKTMIGKVLYLIDQGVRPERIMMSTFTNQATKEMRNRLLMYLDESVVNRITIGTLHSIMYRYLKWYHNKNLVVLGPDEEKTLLKELLESEREYFYSFYKSLPPEMVLKILRSKYALAFPFFRKYITGNSHRYDFLANKTEEDISKLFFSYKKNFEQFFEYGQQFRKYPVSDSDEVEKLWVEQVYTYIGKKFYDILEQRNEITLTGILRKTYKLLKTDKEFRSRLRGRFDWILVDEFQDLNEIQHLILKEMGSEHTKYFVVGDEDQAIYEWRGANPKYFRGFAQEFSADIRKLTINYRSGENIIDVANFFIREKNKDRIEKDMKPTKKGGDVYFLVQPETSIREVVIELVKNLLRKGAKDIGILYRRHKTGSNIEYGLLRENIEYVMFGDLSFTEKKVVKDIYAVLKFAVDPHNEWAFRRAFLNYREGDGENFSKTGVGNTTVDKLLAEWFLVSSVSIEDFLRKEESYTAIKRGRKKAYEVINRFLDKIEKLREIMNSISPQTFTVEPVIDFILFELGYAGTLKEIVNSDMKNLMKSYEMSPDEAFKEAYGKREMEIKVLINILEEKVVEIEEGLTGIDMWRELTNMATFERKEKEDKEARVKLMTIHNAKGLEFQVVICPDFHLKSFTSDNEEEENRIGYVLLTRAKDKLFLVAPEVDPFNEPVVYHPKVKRV